jgi:hypothetical protein
MLAYARTNISQGFKYLTNTLACSAGKAVTTKNVLWRWQQDDLDAENDPASDRSSFTVKAEAMNLLQLLKNVDSPGK